MASWVAVQGADKAALLEAVGLEETAERVEPGSRRRPFSLGELPDGWLVVFSEDFEWGSPKRAIELSRHGRTISLQFEDKSEMTAIACEAVRGAQVWRVAHDAADAELEVEGTPPSVLASIRQEFERLQSGDDSVDYLHEIPIELAKAVCGYRADEWEPSFAALRRAGAAQSPGHPAVEGGGLGGFLKRLFGLA